MKLQLLTLLLIFSTGSTSIAQRDKMIEQLIRDMPLDCETVVSKTYILIPQLHKAAARDTLERLLAYVEKHCASRCEDLVAFEILYAIEQNLSPEAIYAGETGLDYLNIYNEYIFSRNRGGEYHKYVKDFATSLKAKKNISSMNMILVDFFATNDRRVLLQLKDNKYDNTSLQRQLLYSRKDKNSRWYRMKL